MKMKESTSLWTTADTHIWETQNASSAATHSEQNKDLCWVELVLDAGFFPVKQPPLLIKICLAWFGLKCSQRRSYFICVTFRHARLFTSSLSKCLLEVAPCTSTVGCIWDDTVSRLSLITLLEMKMQMLPLTLCLNFGFLKNKKKRKKKLLWLGLIGFYFVYKPLGTTCGQSVALHELCKTRRVTKLCNTDKGRLE